jgi:hypothetical protein
MNTIPPPEERSYAGEAANQDRLLDERLADIRGYETAGKITPREAASLRVQALEHHIDAVRALRDEFFGNDR